jgi:hypothetical protein
VFARLQLSAGNYPIASSTNLHFFYPPPPSWRVNVHIVIGLGLFQWYGLLDTINRITLVFSLPLKLGVFIHGLKHPVIKLADKNELCALFIVHGYTIFL